MSNNFFKSFFLILTIAFLLAGESLLASHLFASETKPVIEWMPNGIIVNDTKGNSTQKNPKVILSDGDDYIIVWEDSRDGYFDIYAQKIDKNGQSKWLRDGVPICQSPKNQSNPQIISDGSGGAIITWEDYRTSNSDIYAQRIDESGVLAWKVDGIPICGSPRAQLSPKLASDNAGGAIITWYDYRSGKGEDIYAQRIDKGGNSLWKKDGAKIVAIEGTQWYPEIAADGSGGAIITWTDFRRVGESDIYAQRITNDGKTAWTESGTLICTAKENQSFPKIVKSGETDFIITWEDFRNGNSDIYAQSISKDGNIKWDKNGKPVCKLPYNQERPQIVSDKENGAIIGWIKRRGDRSSIWTQRISVDGKILWGDEGKGEGRPKGSQYHLVMTSLGSHGGAIFVWEDSRDGKIDIYARVIKNNGSTIWDHDGIPVCNEIDFQEYPAVVSNKSEDVIIVWQDRRNGNFDIFAEKISKNGKSSWKKDGITINASLGNVSQQGPKLVYDPVDKAYIITWEDSRNGYPDIYVQKIDGKGSLLWGTDGAPACASPNLQTKPQIIYTGMGNTIVIWEDYRDSSIPKIYAQKISINGKPLWKENGIKICIKESAQTNAKIISDGKGGAIIVWTDYRSLERGKDIFIQRISADGTLIFGKEGIPVCMAPCDQTSPEIIYDGSGGAIISWTDLRGGNANSDIYAQSINLKGDILWAADGIPICVAPESQRSQKLCSDGAGGALIVWTDKGGGGYDIYGQRINKGGEVLWTLDGLPLCQVGGTQRDPKIVMSGKDEAIIIWEDYRFANWNIFAQKIDGNGSIKWDIDGVPICTAPFTQYSPGVVSDNGGAIISWEDYRSGKAYNIFAQKVDTDGNVVWEKDGIAISSGEDGERSPEIISNGARGAVIAWEDYRSGRYGIYAQRIRIALLVGTNQD